MSDLDNAINSINASAAKAENTATFLDDMSTFDDQSSVTNPNNGQTVASIPKQVKDRTDELFTAAESDINQAVSDAAQSATDAQDAADSIGRYQGLWPDSGGSADKGDTYQTQVSGTPTGQYFTALQNTTVDPIGDDVNWREVVNYSLLESSFASESESPFENRFKSTNGDIETEHLITSELPTVDGERFFSPKERGGLDYLNEFSQLKSGTGSFWGGTQINIVGDSISQAAFSRDNLNNLWNSILKKNINSEIGESSYGFVTLAQGGFPDNSNAEVHEVTLTGDWIADNTDDTSPSGYSVSTSTRFDYVTIKVPVFQDAFDLWYIPISTGAVRVYVNDVQVGDIFQLSGDGSFPTKLKDDGFVLRNSGDGYCYIKVETANFSQVTLCGVQYRNYTDSVEINNFSHSGRRFTHMSTATINRIYGSAKVVVSALGHNDYTEADSDDVYFAELVNRVNSVASICNEKNVKLIVVDFCWHKSIDESRTRKLLHDLQYAVKGCKYVNIPDYFLPNGEKLSFPDMKDEYKLFDDWSHPNEYGHKLIGETVCKAMQLASTSKQQANDNDGYFQPISVTTTELSQRNELRVKTSGFKVFGRKLLVKLSLSYTGTGNLPGGGYQIFDTGVGATLQQVKSGGIIGYSNPTPPYSILLSTAGVLSVIVHSDDVVSNVEGVFEFELP